MKDIIKETVCVLVIIYGCLLIIGAVGNYENGQGTVGEMLIQAGMGALITFASWQGVKK